MTKDSRLVYSTDADFGRCKKCGQFEAACRCVPERPSKAPAEQDVRLRLERSGRGGKVVTVITGFQLTTEDLAKLTRELKNHCATGGKAGDEFIELQGDHRDKALAYLQKKDYRGKKAGG